MSNTVKKRPDLARKVTRKTVEREDADLAQGLRVDVNGESYEVRIGDVTPEVARRLRRECGFGFMKLLAMTQEDPDTDLLSTFVWVARLIRGEDVELAECDVTYEAMIRDDFDVAQAGPEVSSHPEA